MFQRSITIKATPEKLFALINDLHIMQTWSAWEKVDPQMKRSYSGEASGKGAKYGWEGNKKIGLGSMEIVESVPNNKIGLQMIGGKFEEGLAALKALAEK